MLIFAILPWIVNTNDTMGVRIFACAFASIMFVLMIICTLEELQYYYIDGNYIVVKSALRTIMKLDGSNVHISTETLPTYFSRGVPTTYKKWICIYDNSLRYDASAKFYHGCDNSKKMKRIQIIYTEKNRKIIRQWIRDCRQRSKDSK